MNICSLALLEILPRIHKYKEDRYAYASQHNLQLEFKIKIVVHDANGVRWVMRWLPMANVLAIYRLTGFLRFLPE